MKATLHLTHSPAGVATQPMASNYTGNAASAIQPAMQHQSRQNVTLVPPTLNELKMFYEQNLRIVLDAEEQLKSALPILSICASSAGLVDAFVAERKKLLLQTTRLQHVFTLTGFTAYAKHNPAMEELMKEYANAIETTTTGTFLRDVELICVSQKTMHYGISAYGSLRSIANLLGYSQAAALLQLTLHEKATADDTFTQLLAEINTIDYKIPPGFRMANGI